MVVKPFSVEHLEAYAEPGAIRMFSQSLYNRLRREIMSNPAFTLFTKNNEIVGSGGIVQLWPRVGEAWLMVTPTASFTCLPAYMVLRRTMHNLMTFMRLKRLQAVVQNNIQSYRLAVLLGFMYEGTMRGYDFEGNACHIMAIINQG